MGGANTGPGHMGIKAGGWGLGGCRDADIGNAKYLKLEEEGLCRKKKVMTRQPSKKKWSSKKNCIKCRISTPELNETPRAWRKVANNNFLSKGHKYPITQQIFLYRGEFSPDHPLESWVDRTH